MKADIASFRLAMVIPPSAIPTALRVANLWVEALGTPRAEDAVSRRLCIFVVNGDAARDEGRPSPICWHSVHVPRAMDRYLAIGGVKTPWYPWGTKSGPNHQFFSVLDQIRSEHPEPWTVLIEPDTFPVARDLQQLISATTRSATNAWMIGGLPHPMAQATLAPEIRHHLNGAAAYRTDSHDFAEFRECVWIPSLLELIRDRPTLAFDCLTDPSLQSLLTPSLAAAWAEVQPRFQATRSIVNVSNRRISRDVALRLVEEANDEMLSLPLRPKAWMIHAKGIDGFDLAPPFLEGWTHEVRIRVRPRKSGRCVLPVTPNARRPAGSHSPVEVLRRSRVARLGVSVEVGSSGA